MMGGDSPDGLARPSPEQVEVYRRAAARPPVAVQVAQISTDLLNLSILRPQDIPLARGAALALAHGALKLAVTLVVDAGDRRRRSEVLRDEVMPVLVGGGLEHVVGLVEAALAHDGDPGRLGRGVETKQ